MNNNKDTIKDKVLNEINSHNLKPSSMWYFRLKNLALWTPGALVTILGSFAVAGILFSAVHSGWEYRHYTNKSLVGFLYQVVPLLWIGSLILFGTVIVKTLRFTSRGYKYKTGIILIISFATSIFLGAGLFALDMTVKKNYIIRSQTQRIQRSIWVSPGQGRLAGVIVKNTEGVFLTDSNGKYWILDTNELSDRDILIDNLPVRLVGEVVDTETFFTCLVLPWDLSNTEARRSAPLKMNPRPEFTSRCREIVKTIHPKVILKEKPANLRSN